MSKRKLKDEINYNDKIKIRNLHNKGIFNSWVQLFYFGNWSPILLIIGMNDVIYDDGDKTNEQSSDKLLLE